MPPEQLEGLRTRRVAIAALVQQMVAAPASERPVKPSELKQWLRDLETSQRLVAEMDRLIARAELQSQPAPAAALLPARQPRAFEGADQTVLARITKTKRSELRVTACFYEGRRTIDVRIWSKFGDIQDYAATRKGVQLGADDLGALIDALRLAQQHA